MYFHFYTIKSTYYAKWHVSENYIVLQLLMHECVHHSNVEVGSTTFCSLLAG